MSDLTGIINNSSDYVADNMGEYTVNGITYKGYSEYTFAWEKSYTASPERASNGTMGNLDTCVTFVTPHMIVNYNVMTINDYRSIMKQYLENNEVIVSCYDPINDTITTNKMYFATPSTPKFYTLTSTDADGKKVVELLGVLNYTVELIGTNNPLGDE